MLGKLTIDALPFYSWIAMGGAGVTVLGGLIVAALALYFGIGRVWKEWLTSVDHKRIGIMYVTLSGVMLLRGFADAIMMRSQQAVAFDSQGYLPPDHFNQVFSSHGTIMIFFVAMPFLVGLMNIVVPQQIGARDVAFPFMNAVSLWLTAAGAVAGAGFPGGRQVFRRRAGPAIRPIPALNTAPAWVWTTGCGRWPISRGRQRP